MKTNPILIVQDHLDTLRDFGSNKRSTTDILRFYGLPALFALGSYWEINLATNDFYNVSITFFGIFIALLLNIQVAVFGVFQRPWQRLDDERSAEIQKDVLRKRSQLLQEINSNISYAVLFSCLALFMFIVFYGLNLKVNVSTSISVFIYLHFLLTLLLIIKRFHALFRKEYKESNS